jgi:hypothetical protein
MGLNAASELPKQLTGRARDNQGSKAEPVKQSWTVGGGLRLAEPKPVEPAKEKQMRKPQLKHKNDPSLVAAARELAIANRAINVSMTIEVSANGGRISAADLDQGR